MTEELISGAHIKYQAVYHMQWVTKYRYKVFRKEKYKYDYENILYLLAKRYGLKLLDVAVMADHIHVVASFSSSFSVSKVFHILKGASSREFFLLHPEFRLRYPRGHLFSSGKFFRTVSDVDLKTIRKYVQDQILQKNLLDL